MQSRTKVRRRVLACARCRKRKLSCDGKVPSCTRCVDAGVECVGFDSSTQREAPRSIADALERHIASLQQSQSSTSRRAGHLNSFVLSPAASLHSDGVAAADKSTWTGSLVNEVMADITPKFLGVSQSRPILSCVVKGTQIPSKRGPVGATDLDENHPRSIINPQPAKSGLDAIDQKTATGLFKTFLDRVITQYPIYHRSDVIAAFNSIYFPAANPGQDSPRHRYMMSIIMAISLSTAARTNQMAANQTAYTLVRQAMQWIPEVATNDLAGLQAILLLTHYTFLNPSMADLWLLTGLISQAVIDLGLHQELPNDPNISPYQRDMRRRLFWCAWEMEVAVCSIFLRPINLPTRSINVKYPVEIDDRYVTEGGIDPSGKVAKFTSRRIWMFRQLEAEIISVLHQNDPIPKDCATLDEWLARTEVSIYRWREEVFAAETANEDPAFKSRWQEMHLYADIATPYIIVLLYRPSPRLQNPTAVNLLKVFTSAVEVAENYWHQSMAEFGNIKYVFHPCHHSFNCAIEFLRALSRCKIEISENFTYEQVEVFMATFSKFFSTIAERWPAAQRCLEEYERLLAQTKKEYVDFLEQKSKVMYQQTTPLEQMPEELYGYPTNLDEAFNIWAGFNPATTVDVSDSLGAFYSHTVPIDWNTEFNLNLGMEVIPEV
ncbi:fungal-specific transcription factor domain-containing protein [Lophiotrema nucula]|uniref:Fungal-specific transcription factor domain-containing protein n=1 Tax=Lophiotrema nucula TaxID=690887 RepID=A0A6A5Z085_9PLEO|nr:fungal-specific transcription factor domain-containing protein [Lophiotrema nucula]